MWSVLFVTLPTRPTAVRVRTWRALKALGSPALRDGTYLLPQTREDLFQPIADDIQSHGGSALCMRLAPSSPNQQDELMALFNRDSAYASWHADAASLLQAIGGVDEVGARRRLRGLAQSLEDLHRIDYWPGAAAEQAVATLASLRGAIDARFSPGEPRAGDAHPIVRLQRDKFRGRRWATRARPWVDRLACGWLIRRFVDPEARFVWLTEVARLPRGAVGYDFDGARFSHVGARVSFEVIGASFGLDTDAALQRIAAMVRYLDVGGIPVPEAAGLEAVLAGLRAQHADDDVLLAAAAQIFDALYASPAQEARR